MHKVITFGCRLNILESEAIKGALAQDLATNTIVFNTCSVTKEAERKAMQAIRKARRENPDANIVVTGCAAQINPSRWSSMKEVSKVLGNEEKFLSSSYASEEKILVNDIMSIKETAGHLVSSFESRTRAFLQVQNGCNHRCTFCIIPYGRGNSRSVSVDKVVSHVHELVTNDYKEIVLTGVDVTDYGLDLTDKPTLGLLVQTILKRVPTLQRLRLSSIDVAEIDETLMDLMKHEPRLMPHFHISLQSGDDMILKRMKRRHSRSDVLKFCDTLKKYRSDVSFGADIISGFPTETDQMFENSLRLIEEADLHFLHVFPYSEREGTPAARMPQVEKKIRKERAKILIDKGTQNLEKFSRRFVGKTLEVLTEQGNVARAPNFLKIHMNDLSAAGALQDALITSYSSNQLIGERR